MNYLTDRTPQIIAAEINSIKDQTQRILLQNSIEIGRRLVEAKELVGHGNWGEWLETSVDYSQRTASNLIRIFEEYGSSQITLLADNSNSQALANLTYTQAVALLGIPQEERENFAEENKIDEMTTRQLNDAVKERDKAIKEKKELEKKLGTLEGDLKREQESKAAVETSLKLMENNLQANNSEEELKELRDKLKALEDQLKASMESEPDESSEDLEEQSRLLDELQEKLRAAEKTIKELEEASDKEPETVEVVPQSVVDELEQLRKKISAGEKAASFTVLFKSSQNTFNEMLEMITAMDEEMANKYKNAIKVLCGQIINNI